MIEILKDRSVINVTGPDSQKFLQTIVTNDLVNNKYSYNYLLNNKGRYLFDMFIFNENSDSFFLDIFTSDVDGLLKHLTMYKLRSNCNIQDLTKNYAMLYAHLELSNEGTIYSLKDPRYSKLGYRSLIVRDKIPGLNIVENLYLSDKYRFAITDGYIDLSKNSSIPINYGAAELGAISYSKGCYLGQEVISRAKYQGVVRKKIFKVIFENTINRDLSGKEIYLTDQKKIGTITSNYKSEAIALINTDLVDLGKEIEYQISESISCKILPPEWMQIKE